jgi:hypothetical protein
VTINGDDDDASQLARVEKEKKGGVSGWLEKWMIDGIAGLAI